MKYRDVVVRPHMNVAKAPRVVALLAVALALIQLACDHGSTVAPTSVSGAPGSNTGGTTVGTSASTQTYRLYGRIHDRWQGGLDGAKVELVTGPDAGASAFTQRTGSYEFPNLHAGTYVVRASRAGYQTRDIQQDLGADIQLDVQLEATPVPSQSGFFEGKVGDLVTGQSLDGVLVEAIAGVGMGATTTTNGAGIFWFEMAPGATKFRWSKQGYRTVEFQYSVGAGSTTIVSISLEKILPPSPVPIAPYIVTGTVTDSRRNPVIGAEVWVYGQMSPIDNRYATGVTDSAGHYTLSSPQRVPQQVRALKPGYVTRDILTLPAPVVATSTWTVDVTIPHIDRYKLLSPTSVKIGQSARMEAQVELDDGSVSTGLFYTAPSSSSNPSVAWVDPATGWIQGIAQGTATITTTYYGVSASIQVRVDP